MAITGISANNAVQSPFPLLSQTRQDFSAMMNALKMGDLEAAHEAFTAVQQDVQAIQTKITDAGLTPFFGTRPVDDLKAIKTALESGDISEARKAFDTLMQDLRQIRRRHLIYYHRHQAGADSGQENGGIHLTA